MFLLPDRHVPLQLLDPVPAGLERLGAVRRRARHHDGDVAQIELAEPVEERDPAERPAFEQLVGDHLEPALGLLLPCLVREARHGPRIGVVAHGPQEDAGSARRGVAHELDRLPGADRIRRDAHEQVGSHAPIVASGPAFEPGMDRAPA
jgi:hypothetical protein